MPSLGRVNIKKNLQNREFSRLNCLCEGLRTSRSSYLCFCCCWSCSCYACCCCCCCPCCAGCCYYCWRCCCCSSGCSPCCSKYRKLGTYSHGSHHYQVRGKNFRIYLRNFNSDADPNPGSGAFSTPGSGMGKKSGTGSGMNNPDHIS
jgi:hypothetical protein